MVILFCFFLLSRIKIYYVGLKCSTQVDLQTKVARICTKQWPFIITNFITKKCYKINYKKLLTSLQSVTKLITKSYWLHHKKMFHYKRYWFHHKKVLQNSLQKVTDFIKKNCYKIYYKKLLTSSQKNVTKFITKGYWLHHNKVLQNSVQKVTNFLTKKCYKIHYKKLLTSSKKDVTKFTTKSYWLHYKKCYKIHYKKLLTSS